MPVSLTIASIRDRMDEVGAAALVQAGLPPTAAAARAALKARLYTTIATAIKEAFDEHLLVSSHGAGGGVTSVNGDAGPAVVLDAVDVGADATGTAAAAVAAHEGLADPHPGYETTAEGTAKANAAQAAAEATAAAALAAHVAAADPHTGYQKESEKGSANGYASLDANGLVPVSQLPANGGVMLTGSTWDRPAPESVDAGTRFLDVDSLVAYTSSGLASPGWAVELGVATPYGRDQAGLLMSTGLCVLGSENVSAYTRGAATMAMLFYWDGGGSGFDGLFCIGTLTTGTLLVLNYSGANLLLQTYQNAVLTTLQTFAPASALAVGLHAVCIAPVSSGGDKWRWSFDASAVADTAMAAAWVAPSSTGNVTFGSSISDSSLSGKPIDLAVWGSTLSNADILALATLPGTPTYRLPITSGMGVPSIRVEASRYNPVIPTQLFAKGLTRPLVVGAAVQKWSPA